jgi:hypothetical protein
MRRQGLQSKQVAVALGKTERAVAQKYLKLVPLNGPRRKAAAMEPQMTEQMKIKLLSEVARKKSAFWSGIARAVGEGATPAQCEEVYTNEIKRRG